MRLSLTRLIFLLKKGGINCVVDDVVVAVIADMFVVDEVGAVVSVNVDANIVVDNVF